MPYVDIFVAPVRKEAREAYLDFTGKTGALCREFGATRMTEFWGDDIPAGEVTSYPMAVKAADDEVVVVSVMEWPDKAARDAGMGKMMSDPRMAAIEMPFDGKRALVGGFEKLMEH